MKSRFRALGLILLGLWLYPPIPATAADFPVKGTPISIIVPYAPGGTTDAAARLLAADLEKEFGTPVQVVNKAGAASQVGMTALIQSKPDGYTLGYAVLPTITTHYLDPQREAPYTRKDFTPVGLHFAVPMMLAVQTSSRYQTLKDFVEAAKAAPEKLTISDSGLLGTPHMAALILEQVAGVRFVPIHYAGGAPSITALLGGHVEALAGGIPDAVVNFKSGKFRVLGIADDQMSEFLPGAPTMKSQGYDVVLASSTGMLAPPGTPKAVIDILTGAMKKIIASESHVKKLTDLGITPRYLDPAQYNAFWASQEESLGPLLKKVRAK